MLDLETLGTGPDAVILTLGAVKFNPFDPDADIIEELYLKLDVDSQFDLGRVADDSTIEWWGKQKPEVREEAFSSENRVSLDFFTKKLNKFISGHKHIWAQGPVFDIVILENLYKQLGQPAPWAYYAIRDSRTLFGALGDDRKSNRDQIHNALADCIYQVKALQSAVARYSLTTL